MGRPPKRQPPRVQRAIDRTCALALEAFRTKGSYAMAEAAAADILRIRAEESLPKIGCTYRCARCGERGHNRRTCSRGSATAIHSEVA